MTAVPPSHRVFVDFENVSDIDLSLIVDQPVHVSLLIGKNQTKLAIDLVKEVLRLGTQAELIEVGASGHNALDLTLAFYLGQAVHRCPDAHFWIVSKDKDFEAMIGHLRHRPATVTVARCGEFDQLPFLSARPKPRAPSKANTSLSIGRRSTHQGHRPSQKSDHQKSPHQTRQAVGPRQNVARPHRDRTRSRGDHRQAHRRRHHRDRCRQQGHLSAPRVAPPPLPPAAPARHAPPHDLARRH